jgi:prevent-host-death family protein
MITSVSTQDLRTRLNNLLARLQHRGQRFVVEHRGEPVAALLSINEYRELLKRIEDLEDALDLKEAIETSEGIIPWEEVQVQLDRGVL